MRALIAPSLLFALSLTGSSAFAADDKERHFELGVAGGAVLMDPLDSLGTSWTVVPRLGYFIDKDLAIEADLGFLSGKTSIGAPDPFDYTAFTPRIGILGRVVTEYSKRERDNQGVKSEAAVKGESPVNLLLGMGVGVIGKSINDGGALGLPTGDKLDLDFLANAGPGLLVPIGQSGLALRTDLRFLLTLGTENFQNHGDAFLDWEWTTGVMYEIGGPKDKDDDGVEDSGDSCLDAKEDIDSFEDEDGCPDDDNDKDGVLDIDGTDKAPNDPEDKDGFADADGVPDPDNDEDGVLDGVDECKEEKGSVDTAGCPDNDGDKIRNADDECPDDAGPASSNGCPDRDSDRVPDHRDECPDEPAPKSVDPRKSDGCPSRVYFEESALKITEKILFASGKSVIDKKSFGLLDDIAKVLQKYPGVKKVQVEGHTDSDGVDAANLKLSQGRVDAVVKYLVGKGVAVERLAAQGFGESKPLGDNATKEGKEQNRRVEFSILEQDLGPKLQKRLEREEEKGDAAPVEAPKP